MPIAAFDAMSNLSLAWVGVVCGVALTSTISCGSEVHTEGGAGAPGAGGTSSGETIPCGAGSCDADSELCFDPDGTCGESAASKCVPRQEPLDCSVTDLSCRCDGVVEPYCTTPLAPKGLASEYCELEPNQFPCGSNICTGPDEFCFQDYGFGQLQAFCRRHDSCTGGTMSCECVVAPGWCEQGCDLTDAAGTTIGCAATNGN